MPSIAKLIGGAGTGKTTELMRILSELVDRGVDPFDVGFVSFTRAARAEAAERVEREFGTSAEALQASGYFRTLHAICYQALGGRFGDRLITETKADRKWLEESIGEQCSGYGGAGPDEDSDAKFDTEDSNATAVLRLWSIARNRLESLAETREAALRAGESIPSIEYCRRIVKSYEAAKRLDDRLDFVDLAGRFCGYKWELDDEPSYAGKKEGLTPDIPVWIFDEHQDVSRLLDSVAWRLVESPGTHWVYISGDPFQSVYTFSGSDHRCLLDFPCEKYRVMQQSWRCPKAILEFGEAILRKCSDYFDREIAPMGDAGVLRRAFSVQDFLPMVDDKESWLLLARTNYLTGKLKACLDSNGIPWDYTRGAGGYVKPRNRLATSGLSDLAMWRAISSSQWLEILRVVPAGRGENAYLQRGVKTEVVSGNRKPPKSMVTLDTIVDNGGTELLRETIISGRWTALVDGADKFAAAERRLGRDAAMSPRIRIGTIHSVKGSEADNVVMLDSLTSQCHRARACVEGRDAENRIAYVGATRARKRLFVLSQRRDRWRMEI